MLQQMVGVAELEAGMISDRTKKGLAAAKRKGKKLGGNRGAKPTAKMRARSTAVLRERANALQAAGAASLRAIADGLNGRGIPDCPRQWRMVCGAGQRVLDRL